MWLLVACVLPDFNNPSSRQPDTTILSVFVSNGNAVPVLFCTTGTSPYTNIKTSAKNVPKCTIARQKMKKKSGGKGHSPLPRSLPPPELTLLGASILEPSAFGVPVPCHLRLEHCLLSGFLQRPVAMRCVLIPEVPVGPLKTWARCIWRICRMDNPSPATVVVLIITTAVVYHFLPRDAMLARY